MVKKFNKASQEDACLILYIVPTDDADLFKLAFDPSATNFVKFSDTEIITDYFLKGSLVMTTNAVSEGVATYVYPTALVPDAHALMVPSHGTESGFIMCVFVPDPVEETEDESNVV